MKRLIILSVLFFIFLPETIKANNNRVNFGYFYSELAAYGEWIDLDDDLIVWRPLGVHRDWQPYRTGRWYWTSEGWYWDSYEPFGWATYHYGRWFFDDFYGWVWLPDYEWAPAWVEWRYSDDYIGWAPLSPYSSFRVGIGIHFTTHSAIPYRHWHFVKTHHFHDIDVHHYIVNERYNHRILSNTKYRTNYYRKNGRIFNGGIERRYIERHTGKSIQEKEIVTTRTRSNFKKDTPVRSRSIEVYRPSEKELRETRTTKEITIRRGEKSSSIDRSKLNITRSRNIDESQVKRSRETDNRNDSKTSRSRSANTEMKTKTRKSDTDRATSRDSRIKKQSRSVKQNETSSKTRSRNR